MTPILGLERYWMYDITFGSDGLTDVIHVELSAFLISHKPHSTMLSALFCINVFLVTLNVPSVNQGRDLITSCNTVQKSFEFFHKLAVTCASSAGVRENHLTTSSCSEATGVHGIAGTQAISFAQIQYPNHSCNHHDVNQEVRAVHKAYFHANHLLSDVNFFAFSA